MQIDKGLTLVHDTILPLLSPKNVPHKVHILNKHTDTETIARAIADKAAELGAHSITLAHHQKGALKVCPHAMPTATCKLCTLTNCAHHQRNLHLRIVRAPNLLDMHNCPRLHPRTGQFAPEKGKHSKLQTGYKRLQVCHD